MYSKECVGPATWLATCPYVLALLCLSHLCKWPAIVARIDRTFDPDYLPRSIGNYYAQGQKHARKIGAVLVTVPDADVVVAQVSWLRCPL